MSRKNIRQFGPGGGPWFSVPGAGAVFDTGTTVPADTTPGYAPGCIFIDLDAAAGSQVWINEGTVTSAAFKAVSSSSTGTFTNLSVTNAAIANAAISNGSLAAAGTMTLGNLTNFALGTGSGTRVGTAANQKLGLFGVTPVVQPATTGTVAGVGAGNGSTNANLANVNFTGNSGSTAYTIGDIVANLKALGILTV